MAPGAARRRVDQPVGLQEGEDLRRRGHRDAVIAHDRPGRRCPVPRPQPPGRDPLAEHRRDLLGALVTGVLMALFMANAGGAWDNAKKYIEGGEHGGKGSPAHKAAVVGDTVGEPFKDTSSPAMNILIKLMTIVSLVFAPVIYQYGGLILKIMK